MRIIIYPYKIASKGAHAIQDYLRQQGFTCLRVHPDQDYAPRPDDVIKGWGSGHTPAWLNRAPASYLNKSENICSAIHKPTSFRLMSAAGVMTVPWMESQRTAQEYVEDGFTVFCRTAAEGMDGAGIVVAEHLRELVPASLYTVYIPSTMEYRVHVFDGAAFIVQEKRELEEWDGQRDPRIKTTSNGYCFTRRREAVHPSVMLEAAKAVDALGLQFGGVDVLFDGKRARVLEVNTAPDIVGTDIQEYGQQIIRYAGRFF